MPARVWLSQRVHVQRAGASCVADAGGHKQQLARMATGEHRGPEIAANSIKKWNFRPAAEQSRRRAPERDIDRPLSTIWLGAAQIVTGFDLAQFQPSKDVRTCLGSIAVEMEWPSRLRRPRYSLSGWGKIQMQILNSWKRWVPGLAWLRQYQASWLAHDIVAGIVLTTMLVPVGIAYAVASGVPGIYGLYATIVPLLAYALFGPSRILVLGPDSSLAAVILGVILPLSGGDPGRAVALASMMAIVSGAVCIIAGVARLGFITELLSKPIRYGYMNGIALTVLISQLPKLFGFSIESEGPLRNLWAITEGVVGGKVNWTAFAVGSAR